ncbi:MAG: VCBS repeat-containing protein, partial [Planctomycetales bacterium]|nr:VCBS repeat-containing protein [Planctomycetales bacterium]
MIGLLFLTGCDGCVRRPSGGTPDPRTSAGETTGLSVTTEVVRDHNRAVALMGQFDYGAAHDVLQELVAAHPDWLDGKVDLAIATLNRRQEGDSDAAITLLQDVIRAAPNNLRAYYCLGILSLDNGDPEAARELFAKVAQADPTDAYASYYVGQCEFQLGQVESALSHYRAALKTDPYLRSCYYGAFQACMRLEQAAEAEQFREDFERLDGNPQARLAEIKYTRMGPKAELTPLHGMLPSDVPPPAGSVFAGDPWTLTWKSAADVPRGPASQADMAVSAAVLDESGDNLFVVLNAYADAAAPNLVFTLVDGQYRNLSEHAFRAITQPTAIAWGDYDNDGLTDAYIARRGENQLWRQVSAGKWQDVTAATGTAGADLPTLDCQMFDADHDGDLDLLLLNDGPNELLSNNLDGTFRPLAVEHGLTGAGGRSTAALVFDFDRDRDLDLLVVNEGGANELYLNDRLWRYRAAELPADLAAVDLRAAVVADLDADGQAELIVSSNGALQIWRVDDGQWDVRPLATQVSPRATPPARLAWADLDGDGGGEIAFDTDEGWAAVDAGSGELKANSTARWSAWMLTTLPAVNGPAVLGWLGEQPQVWLPGPGRYEFIKVMFTGKQEQADQMRSNRSGIGVTA